MRWDPIPGRPTFCRLFTRRPCSYLFRAYFWFMQARLLVPSISTTATRAAFTPRPSRQPACWPQWRGSQTADTCTAERPTAAAAGKMCFRALILLYHTLLCGSEMPVAGQCMGTCLPFLGCALFNTGVLRRMLVNYISNMLPRAHAAAVSCCTSATACSTAGSSCQLAPAAF